MKFSERYRHKPVRETIQIDSIDEELKNGIWSLLKIHYWDKARYSSYDEFDNVDSGCYISPTDNEELYLLCNDLWFNYFKIPLDRLPNDWNTALDELRKYYFTAKWYEIYDFIEFVSNNYAAGCKETNRNFMAACNSVLEKEMSGYRFVNGVITKIIDEEQIITIEMAIDKGDNLVSRHIYRALELLSDRSNPDYRNSIKESISAVERLAAHITKEKGTLGQLLNQLEDHIELHPALKKAFQNMYGYSSDTGGIRHALSDNKEIDFDDAKYMLVVCSAFINYIEGKLKN